MKESKILALVALASVSAGVAVLTAPTGGVILIAAGGAYYALSLIAKHVEQTPSEWEEP